ncbi:regulator (plasmid) [Borrelia sp. A-FGy1]|uniref:Erp family outer-surface lipoprotein n=1 Tax=Borrelia sp. A-FGy1 TaxID=2608247 RepID=UPI001767848C|nr:Erp family outer-surface lipoprotein [Borrelia sp. A-FGy1]QMU99821.1 regulator [Borrelia sp. A-FGy1]
MKKNIINIIVSLLLYSCYLDFQSNRQIEDKNKEYRKIEFTEFSVGIKHKRDSNWQDLGTLVIRRESSGVETGLNAGGHSAGFFDVEEKEVNSFLEAMTKGGSFDVVNYYGYQEGIEGSPISKKIETKIETIDNATYVTFVGKSSSYAIPLDEFKKHLK